MSNDAPQVEIHIRPAKPDDDFDWKALATLLTLRDQRSWSRTEASRTLWDLNPTHCHAWLAFAGSTPVGLSSVFLKPLRVLGAEFLVAYWANLFVDPNLRSTLLYPRLVLSTTQGIRKLGAQALIAGVRRRELSVAHQRLGLAHTETLSVLAKPLRHLRIAARYLKLPAPLVSLAGFLDHLPALTCHALSFPDPFTRQLKSTTDLPESLMPLFNHRHEGIGFIRNYDWMEERATRWKGSEPYTLLWYESKECPTAAAILGKAIRDNNYQIGVILDIVSRDNQAQIMLIKAIERICCHRGDDLVLWMPSGAVQRKVAARQGFRITPETYDILVHPPTFKKNFEHDQIDWHFTFLDHDAF